MLRILVLSLSLAALGLGGVSSARAAYPLSRNNPYRAFNISGINYGSLNWERTHGNASRHSRGVFLFRRR